MDKKPTTVKAGMKRIACDLPNEDHHWLRIKAAYENVPMSEMIRLLVQRARKADPQKR